MARRRHQGQLGGGRDDVSDSCGGGKKLEVMAMVGCINLLDRCLGNIRVVSNSIEAPV